MRIDVLGSLRVRGDDGVPIELGGGLERRVLVALAVPAGAVVSVDALAEAVFGPDGAGNEQIRLQNHISRLRKRLGPSIIVTETPGYRLGPDCRLDCERMQEIVASGTGATATTSGAWEEALALWRGPPFAEVSDWSVAQAAGVRLEELRRVAEEEHAAALLREGRAGEAVGLLESLVVKEPLRERRWALLMIGMYRTGRHADALRVFERARTTLADEVGASPGPDLVDLQRRILAQDPSLATAGAILPDAAPHASDTIAVHASKAQRPTGTVTFLFTDIEGSTRLWRDHPDEMQRALTRHDEILRSGIMRRGGHVFSTGGDGFAVAFASATAAVAAAVDIQLAIAAESWPDPSPIRVRMGLHTGEADERDGDYFGITPSRAARIMAAGYGGQTLASAVIAHLAGARHDVTDLGWHDLSGIGREQLFQINPTGLDARFPPPRARPERHSNLPIPADSFVGRARELEQVAQALATHRLVTVFGVGGMGKTRLVLEAAARAPDFPDGTWLVDLALIKSSTDVQHAVAAALNVRPSPGVTLMEQLAEWCCRADALVILDNCEHVVDGVAELSTAILAAGSNTTIVTTSREPLIVAGEHLIPLGPLAGPSDVDELGDAMRLLVERARAERPDFDDTLHRAALAEICTRLDGMPLAIELAASRLRTLAPAALAERLDERFRLLTGGRRTATERSRTLRATIDWSYDLLTPRQRWLFERISVFSGPFDLDDAAAIAIDALVPKRADPAEVDLEVIDLLGELVDRCLVVAGTGEPPYRLLETLRSYGMERLEATGGSDAVRAIHAEWFHRKACSAHKEACGPLEKAVFEAVMSQLSEYRAATTWALDHHRYELAVGIPAAILQTTWLRSEILGPWQAPDVPDDAPISDDLRARQLWLLSTHLQFDIGDLGAADAALVRARRVGPNDPLVYAQSAVQAMLLGQPEAVRRHAQRVVELAGEEPFPRAAGLTMLGQGYASAGRLDEARDVAIEQLEWARGRAWPSATGWALRLLALVDAEDDPNRALARTEEVLAIARTISSYGLDLVARMDLVLLHIDHRPTAALEVLLGVLHTCRDHQDVGQGAIAMSHAVAVLHRHGDPDTAALVLGNVGTVAPVESAQRRLASSADDMRTALGERFDELRARGAGMTRWALLDTTIDAMTRCLARAHLTS